MEVYTTVFKLNQSIGSFFPFVRGKRSNTKNKETLLGQNGQQTTGMAFNERKYLKYFSQGNLTDEEKLERIRIYKGILQTFVDAAFGQHPVQLCRETPKQKYLQSPNQEVESKKINNKFKNETLGQLRRKIETKKKKKEAAPHANSL